MAYFCMAHMQNNHRCGKYECTPEEYEDSRKQFAIVIKNFYQDKTNHPNYGKHFSEQTKKKMSEIAKNRLKDPTKNSMYGKLGIDNPNFGQKRSQEFSNKLRERNLKFHKENPNAFALEKNPNSKKVIRLSDKKIYDCGKQAAIDNNINYSTFKGQCRNRKNFMYYNDYINELDNLENS